MILPNREQSVALGIFAGLVLLFLVVAVSSFQSVAALMEERDARLGLLDTLKRQTPLRAGAGDPADQRDPFLPGESETIAAAGMQQRVRGLIEAAGGQVFSAQILFRSEEGDPDRRVELQVVFEAGIEAVQKALYRIETEAPFGFVDELSIQPARTDGEAEADPGRLLRTTVTVTSHWRRAS
ncbi:type II secretion system protein GspM [Prosthecomicrobium sp. N25]|uniref:type II secretion system protein GspM n=1 Tax=Prosthecomicrobium sp. N25 TaxID=3129254 RepID=UPI0030776A17